MVPSAHDRVELLLAVETAGRRVVGDPCQIHFPCGQEWFGMSTCKKKKKKCGSELVVLYDSELPTGCLRVHQNERSKGGLSTECKRALAHT